LHQLQDRTNTYLGKDAFIAQTALAILTTIVAEPDTVDILLLHVPAVLALHNLMDFPTKLPLREGRRKPQVFVRQVFVLFLQAYRTQAASHSQVWP
jgi:hypothetical protein